MKHPTLPQWPSSEIVTAMKLRDRPKRDKKFEDYKIQKQNKTKQTNKQSHGLVRAGEKRKEKKACFSNLINDNRDTASVAMACND